MSGWELEHSPAAEDVTTMGLLVVLQFEVYPACLTKGLIDLKSQVASITYNQVRLITLKFPSSSSSSIFVGKFTYYFVAIIIISYT